MGVLVPALPKRGTWKPGCPSICKEERGGPPSDPSDSRAGPGVGQGKGRKGLLQGHAPGCAWVRVPHGAAHAHPLIGEAWVRVPHGAAYAHPLTAEAWVRVSHGAAYAHPLIGEAWVRVPHGAAHAHPLIGEAWMRRGAREEPMEHGGGVGETPDEGFQVSSMPVGDGGQGAWRASPKMVPVDSRGNRKTPSGPRRAMTMPTSEICLPLAICPHDDVVGRVSVFSGWECQRGRVRVLSLHVPSVLNVPEGPATSREALMLP